MKFTTDHDDVRSSDRMEGGYTAYCSFASHAWMDRKVIYLQGLKLNYNLSFELKINAFEEAEGRRF